MMEAEANAGSAMPTTTVGGLPISILDLGSAAEAMLRAATMHTRGSRPLYFTSANGEVLARIAADKRIADLFLSADQILADGQPLVLGSRLLCSRPLPERVATTDLFHAAAELAQRSGQSFYLLGADAATNEKAAARVASLYPGLRIVGRSHGYLRGRALDVKLAEINDLAPDIIWLGLGVPREQVFVRRYSRRLPNVGLIKTSGGLFDHIAGKTKRAPELLQQAGLEWLWRIAQEPRRLFWRYLTTNPAAAYLILTRSS